MLIYVCIYLFIHLLSVYFFNPDFENALSPNRSNRVAFENILIFTNRVVTVQINNSTTTYKISESQH